MKKLICTLLLSASAIAHAELTVIVPFSAGGTYDLLARKLSVYLEKELLEPVVISNVLGAAGLIAINKLESSNGKTVMLTGSAFYRSLLENNILIDQFNYVSIIADSPLFLGVTKSSGITCDQLKNNNKQYFLGTSGIGSMSSKATSIVHDKYPNINEVPYKGSGQMTADMLSGQIAGTFYNSIPDRSDIVLIANTSPKSIYGIPGMAECFGITETLKTQFLLVANKQIKPEYLKILNTLTIEFTKDPATLDHFKDQGLSPTASNLKSTVVSVVNESSKWKLKDKQ
jgi:tripartite-type tricarboxylate transporter receptor subunit TctC